VKKPLHQAFIGVGANLGDRCATLQGAVFRLRGVAGIERVICSRVYETEPVGVVDQPRFLNAVLGCETTLIPELLLESLLAIELEFGRVRTVRWAARTLDLDLLAFENETRSGAYLTLPHPRMLERPFVTVPLRQVLAQVPFQRVAWARLRAQIDAIAAPPLQSSDCVLPK
jgi:2-amino-4-hydroxy-6-hydroxymethyldihydropteridine diphosphokinase